MWVAPDTSGLSPGYAEADITDLLVDGALVAASTLSHRYITDRFLPDKAIDLLDEAGVQPGAEQVFGTSIDGWTCGFPVEVALDGRDAMIAIGIVFIPVIARLVRGSALSVREHEFVLAAKVLGASHPRIMFLHLLPNLISPLLVLGTLEFARAMLSEASLSFLGLGARPPTPEWGFILNSMRGAIYIQPWVAALPGLFIFATSRASGQTTCVSKP